MRASAAQIEPDAASVVLPLRGVGLVGSRMPRLFTPPLRPLTRETSRGFEVADFAEHMLGQPLLPWQEELFVRGLEVLPDGRYRFRTVLATVSRQNGKTHAVRTLALWRLFLDGAQLVLSTAQSLEIASEAWRAGVEVAQANEHLVDDVANVRLANGQQELRTTSGARWKVAASSRSAGRGLSVDLLVMDELREQRSWDAWSALSKTTIARPNGQTWCISNAGDDESVVLNHLRDAALAGESDDLAILEWSAPADCDLDDREAWAQANPALGHTLPEAALKAALSTDPPQVFRTECLTIRVDSMVDAAVPADAWSGCLDTAMTLDGLRDRVALCVDVSPDLGHATLCAAAVGDDNRVRVEVVAAWESTGALLADLPEWVKRVKPRARGYFRGPADAVRVDLEALGFGAITEVTAACQALAEQVIGRRLLHAGNGLLTNHVTGTKRYPVADGWRFVRRGAGHCDSAYAAAGAVHLARTLPASLGKPRILVSRA